MIQIKGKSEEEIMLHPPVQAKAKKVNSAEYHKHGTQDDYNKKKDYVTLNKQMTEIL